MYRSINHYNTDPSGQATSTTVTRLPSSFDENELELWNVKFWRLKSFCCENITNWTIFILFKRAIKHVCARKKLIVKEKQHFFISTFLHLQHWKNKDNDFLCQLCFLSLYLFWLTTCIFDCFYLQIHVTVMSW